MPTFVQDALFTVRQLRKNPAFAFTSIASLALGIGATTAVFSVVYGVLMNPYPYRDPDRLTYLVLHDKAGNDRWPGLRMSQVRQLRQFDSIESILAMNEWNLTTTDTDLPEDVVAYYLSANGMAHLGVPPLLGRGLIASDAPDGQDPQPVVVLGCKFWQTRYGGAATFSDFPSSSSTRPTQLSASCRSDSPGRAPPCICRSNWPTIRRKPTSVRSGQNLA